MSKFRLLLTSLLAGVVLHPVGLAAQTPAHDPSGRLQQVLPPAVAQKVLETIADARSRGLPAAALEHRALELQAKGVPPADIPDAVTREEEAMAKGKAALGAGGRAHPSDSEIEAAGTAEEKGIGAAVSSLAKSAPSRHNLTVPIFVLTSLVNRGLPSHEALSRVLARLQEHASDEQLAKLPEQARGDLSHKPETTDRSLAATKRPTSVPENGGRGTRPTSVPDASTPSHPGSHP